MSDDTARRAALVARAEKNGGPAMRPLTFTPEQARVAFYLFGAETSMPCPDCLSGWGSSTSKDGVVTPAMPHLPGCVFDRDFLSKSKVGKR